ncbi:hypothetical protein LVB87_11575 [Lysobacter sp. KIS68-7]|uniref:hypothetical protein n=1 Tax=Lysobacter sp. KIS68-7 TaxID=2904252 RepID=UPI001E466EF3|nr:hypothetical protein [Lysobacter sp. KIS68-7]UHQ18820.1 hypothetical protein LVB87_11575 [Lysobacter sp. KIS68-7]
MTHQETTLRHLWLAGLGLYARVRRRMDRIVGIETPEKAEPPAVEFVTTQKPAKKVVSKYSSGSRRAGEHESRRRIAGKGR